MAGSPETPSATRRLVTSAILASVTVASFATAAEADVCAFVERKKYIICLVDLKIHGLQLFWKDKDGKAYRSLEKVARKEPNQQVLFVMNAGMYDGKRKPVGLYIEGGHELVSLNTKKPDSRFCRMPDGKKIKNFCIMPNGVFYVTGDTAGLVPSEGYKGLQPTSKIATQSGPMLLIEGSINPNIEEIPGKRIRNGVATCPDSKIAFAISNVPVTFLELTQLFRDRLGCSNALYLDGSISQIYAPNLKRFGKGDFGPMFIAVPR